MYICYIYLHSYLHIHNHHSVNNLCLFKEDNWRILCLWNTLKFQHFSRMLFIRDLWDCAIIAYVILHIHMGFCLFVCFLLSFVIAVVFFVVVFFFLFLFFFSFFFLGGSYLLVVRCWLFLTSLYTLWSFNQCYTLFCVYYYVENNSACWLGLKHQLTN